MRTLEVSVPELQTRLAKQIASGEFGEAVTIIADAEYGLLELVLIGGPSLPGVQRFFLIARNGTIGRQTSFHIDVPLELTAEAGARTYKDGTRG